MRRVYIALLFLILASLACTEPIVTPTPTLSATPNVIVITATPPLTTPTLSPSATLTPAPSGSGRVGP